PTPRPVLDSRRCPLAHPPGSHGHRPPRTPRHRALHTRHLPRLRPHAPPPRRALPRLARRRRAVRPARLARRAPPPPAVVPGLPAHTPHRAATPSAHGRRPARHHRLHRPRAVASARRGTHPTSRAGPTLATHHQRPSPGEL